MVSVATVFGCTDDVFLTFSLPVVTEEVPVGIIAGVTVCSTILLFVFLLVLVLIFYRQRKGSESSSLFLMQNSYSLNFLSSFKGLKSCTQVKTSQLFSSVRQVDSTGVLPVVSKSVCLCSQAGAGSRLGSPTSRWRRLLRRPTAWKRTLAACPRPRAWSRPCTR